MPLSISPCSHTAPSTFRDHLSALLSPGGAGVEIDGVVLQNRLIQLHFEA